MGFLQAIVDSTVIAIGVEKLAFAESPELLFHCCSKPNSFENKFIW
jgi:hypothetical protein